MRDFFSFIFSTTSGISIFSIITRIFFSFIAGFALGLEREVHQHPAGLKTIITITVSSTLLMILSMSFPFINENADPARIAAQVVSGIGFLGGGAILRQGINIRGLTSAAIIWAAAAIGLTIGAGLYYVAVITFIAYAITLISSEKLKSLFIQPENKKVVELEFVGKAPKMSEITKFFVENKIEVLTNDICYNLAEEKTNFLLSVNIPKSIEPEFLKDKISQIGNLTYLYVRE